MTIPDADHDFLYQTIARLERELAEAREKWHDSASMLASATDLLNTQARESGATEARTPESIKTVIDALWVDAARGRQQLASYKADAEALRALAAWASGDADNRVKFHVENQANVWLIDASSKVHYAGGETLSGAIQDALVKVQP